MNATQRKTSFPDDAAKVAELVVENDRLREEIRQLRSILDGEEGRGLALCEAWRLTRLERVLLGLLVSRDLLTHNAAMVVLYAGRVKDPPHGSIIAVHLCKIRRKTGLPIHNVRDTGWFIPKAVREALTISKQAPVHNGHNLPSATFPTADSA